MSTVIPPIPLTTRIKLACLSLSLLLVSFNSDACCSLAIYNTSLPNRIAKISDNWRQSVVLPAPGSPPNNVIPIRAIPPPKQKSTNPVITRSTSDNLASLSKTVLSSALAAVFHIRHLGLTHRSFPSGNTCPQCTHFMVLQTAVAAVPIISGYSIELLVYER